MTEIAWLIERYDSTNRPMWWCGVDEGGSTWSYESLDAVRFCRKIDADAGKNPPIRSDKR